MTELNVATRDRHELDLVGNFCEVFWTPANKLARRQCEKCVYVVRAYKGDMICLELVYDAIDGIHKKDAIYWVPVNAVNYLRILSESEAQRRIDRLEREVYESMPKD
jgi:hypothetical protein